MLEINLVEPKAQAISPFCPGIYILPLWKQVKTHFMTLTLKKTYANGSDRYKLTLVYKDEEFN